MDRGRSIALTPVEERAVRASTFDALYPPTEKVPTIVVDSFPALGKLTAMRFLEWVQDHPGGVISLPTGKTPEYFIKWVERLLGSWESPETQRLLEEAGVDPGRKPDMASLHFVQIDEFYPMDSAQHNSFHYYVKHFYLEGFGLDPAKALLIDSTQIGLEPGETLGDVWPDSHVDLSLRYRHAVNRLEGRQKALLERVDQWCMEYEGRIRELGGIGFFLGGIGPDGHIGFNIRGSDHYSTTRLCPINYETQAAAATDLGGIKAARRRLVITIGLDTITYNPDCVAIVMAAGQAKAARVAQAVESKEDIDTPASSLQRLAGARFFLTRGAAANLIERRVHVLETSPEVTDADVERVLVESAVRCRKRLLDLTDSDVASHRPTSVVLRRRPESLEQLASMVFERLVGKVENGLQVHKGKRFLHTEPHHDDVMLGYFAQVVRHFRRVTNHHDFLTLTSGFTSVTNEFMQEQLAGVRRFLATPQFSALYEEGYFTPDNLMARNRDVWQYLDGVGAQSQEERDEGCARRMIRNLIELCVKREVPARRDEHKRNPEGGTPSDRGRDARDTANALRFTLHASREDIERYVQELEAYFADAYPGRKDPPHVQQLKGMSREWEAECVWAYYGWQCQNVHHLRLSFYTGDIFTQEPTMAQDVPPIVEQLRRLDPDIITVAFDPEGSGPDTHYKVMQAMAEAIRIHLDGRSSLVPRRSPEEGGRSSDTPESQRNGTSRETRDERRDAKPGLQVWGYRNVWFRFDPSEANVFVPVTLGMFSIMHDAFMHSFITQKDASFPSPDYDGPFSRLAQHIQVEQYRTVKTCLGREWFYNHPNALIRATRGLTFLREMTPEEFAQSCRNLRKSVEDR